MAAGDPPEISNEIITDVESEIPKMHNYSEATKYATDVMESFRIKLANVGVNLSGVGNLMSEDSVKFAAVTNSVFGATKAFEQFGNVDTSRLNTFSDQINGLINIVKNHGAASKAGSAAIDEMKESLTKMGVSQSLIAQAVKRGANAFIDFASAEVTSADNGLRLNNAMYQMAASGGQLGEMMHGLIPGMSAAGTGLENINRVGSEYMAVMQNARQSTFSTQEAIESWAAGISKLPNGLSEMMGQITLAGQNTNLLTAAIHFANGAGMEQKDVLGMMSQAMNQYGISGEDALKFTARASEISNAFKGAKLEDVASALKHTSERFKDYVFGGADAAAMTDSLADATESYVGQLRAAGVPAQNAITMAEGLSDKMHGLTIAQQAFLSQQSGGAGGLAGAFDMMEETQKNPAAVQKKLLDALKKQMGGGEIMDLKSRRHGNQEDSAKLMHEVAIMTQGPLKVADTTQQALAMLSAMKKGNQIDFSKNKEEFSLESSVKRGEIKEDMQRTAVGEMAITAQNVQLQTAEINLSAIQRGFAAQTGLEGGIGGTGRAVATNKSEMRDYARSTETRGGSFGDNTIKDFFSQAAGIPASIIESSKSVIENFNSGNIAGLKQSQDKLNEAISQNRAQIAKEPDDLRKTNTAKLNSYLTNLHQQTDQAPTAGQQVANGRHYTPAGQQVGNAIPKNIQSNTTKDNGSTAGLGRNNGPIPVTLVGSGITVNFTGKCPHCNTEIKSSALSNSVSPTAGNRNPQG